MKKIKLSKIFYISLFVIYEFFLVSMPASPVFSQEDKKPLIDFLGFNRNEIIDPLPKAVTAEKSVPKSVSGEADRIVVGGTDFSLSVDAKMIEDKPKGVVIYNRNQQGMASKLNLHGSVQCLNKTENVTVVASRLVGTTDPNNVVNGRDWMYLAIKEGDNGTDSVRLVISSMQEAIDACDSPETQTVFPASVVNGDFQTV